jgi:hypothetical protein
LHGVDELAVLALCGVAPVAKVNVAAATSSVSPERWGRSVLALTPYTSVTPPTSSWARSAQTICCGRDEDELVRRAAAIGWTSTTSVTAP